MSRYFFNMWSIPYFFSFFVSFVITLLLFSKKRADKQIQLYIFSQFFVALLSFAAALATNSLDPNIWVIWSAINLIASTCATATTYHFSYIFLKNSSIFEKKKLVVIYSVPLFYISIYLINSKWIYPNVGETEYSLFGLYGGIEATSFSSLLFLFFYIYIGLMATLATINFFRMFRQNVDLELRRRAAYFVLSSLIPAILLNLTIFLSLFVEKYHPKLEFTIVSLSISGAIIAYGILKDKLFDIDVIVSKSVQYTLLNIGLAWIFILSRETLISLISDLLFSGNQVATLLAGFIVVTALVPIKGTTSSLTTKLFPHTRVDTLPTTRDLEIYQKQLEFVWTSDNITEQERKERKLMLNALRTVLGISMKDHELMECKVLDNRKKQ
ncbi:MAG: histidine kinase N-terminal 7TM domain-containing protein [Candidatus Aminicenantia bacterium]